MSDDLAKRLRDHIAVTFGDRGHVFEDETLCDDAADRIEELEAKLAVAVEALEVVAEDPYQFDQRVRVFKRMARATLAEIKGEKP